MLGHLLNHVYSLSRGFNDCFVEVMWFGIIFGSLLHREPNAGGKIIKGNLVWSGFVNAFNQPLGKFQSCLMKGQFINVGHLLVNLLSIAPVSMRVCSGLIPSLEMGNVHKGKSERFQYENDLRKMKKIPKYRNFSPNFAREAKFEHMA